MVPFKLTLKNDKMKKERVLWHLYYDQTGGKPQQIWLVGIITAHHLSRDRQRQSILVNALDCSQEQGGMRAWKDGAGFSMGDMK